VQGPLELLPAVANAARMDGGMDLRPLGALLGDGDSEVRIVEGLNVVGAPAVRRVEFPGQRSDPWREL